MAQLGANPAIAVGLRAAVAGVARPPHATYADALGDQSGDRAVVTHCLAGQPVLGPEPARIPAVQTPGKSRRDWNDGPAGRDQKIHPCCADAALALADVRHGGAADYSFAERICHAKRKLLGAAIEAPLRSTVVSGQERC